ncbi:hypothetical protein [Pseudomonas sp. Ps21-P2]|uniref:hypothetical protein n=1 Tax=Pseudomonas sp. Ps21-P2 TaxID=3080331 RepID=UPI003209A09C
MSAFDRILNSRQVRNAQTLDALCTNTSVVIERTESTRGCFAFPGTEFVAGIEVDGQRMGTVEFGINPLNDRVYIYDLTIDGEYQGRGDCDTMASVVHSPGALGAAARSRNLRGILEQGAPAFRRCRRRNQTRYPHG